MVFFTFDILRYLVIEVSLCSCYHFVVFDVVVLSFWGTLFVPFRNMCVVNHITPEFLFVERPPFCCEIVLLPAKVCQG